MTASDLKSCPFCGGAGAFATVRYSAKMVQEQCWVQDTYHYVSCISCSANNMGLVGWRDEQEAAERWNRRVPDGASHDHT